MKKLSKRIFAAVLLVVIVITSAFLWRANLFQTQPPPLGMVNSAGSCRKDPLAHVYNPSRLILLSECASLSGTVRETKYNPGDGDMNVAVVLDTQYSHLLVP